MYLISACLLGDNCKYNGGNNANEKVIEFAKTHSYMKVCPEVTGGLPTPRPPAEIQQRPAEIEQSPAGIKQSSAEIKQSSAEIEQNSAEISCKADDLTRGNCYKILNVEGTDVTENFLTGARVCLAEALAEAAAEVKTETAELQHAAAEVKTETAELQHAAAEVKTETAELQHAAAMIQGAILKAKSPSCGSGMVYDGTFSGTLVKGDGVFAAELKKLNIPVITEKEL